MHRQLQARNFQFFIHAPTGPSECSDLLSAGYAKVAGAPLRKTKEIGKQKKLHEIPPAKTLTALAADRLTLYTRQRSHTQ